MSKLSASTILNFGSIATFIAFPLLYSASFGGAFFPLALGTVLVLFSMVTPFVALKITRSAQPTPADAGKNNS